MRHGELSLELQHHVGERRADQPRGVVLVTGPTGSGKSTTLAAMIDHRNKNSTGHILTIEDPVEYMHPHQGCVVNQREVGVDTKSYAAALKSSLREAPDVILIGEIRTRETMEHAINFSETGHLCLSTLHANSADQALDRIAGQATAYFGDVPQKDDITLIVGKVC